VTDLCIVGTGDRVRGQTKGLSVVAGVRFRPRLTACQPNHDFGRFTRRGRIRTFCIIMSMRLQLSSRSRQAVDFQWNVQSNFRVNFGRGQWRR
jgi:hypothetical protein